MKKWKHLLSESVKLSVLPFSSPTSYIAGVQKREKKKEKERAGKKWSEQVRSDGTRS